MISGITIVYRNYNSRCQMLVTIIVSRHELTLGFRAGKDYDIRYHLSFLPTPYICGLGRSYGYLRKGVDSRCLPSIIVKVVAAGYQPSSRADEDYWSKESALGF